MRNLAGSISQLTILAKTLKMMSTRVFPHVFKILVTPSAYTKKL